MVASWVAVWVLGTELGPLQEQQALLPTELSLAYPVFILYQLVGIVNMFCQLPVGTYWYFCLSSNSSSLDKNMP